ncbi:cysteine desulfurase [Sphingomonas ginsenosidivorax]|uniref:Cysteine desulfurase n=1 Tax=Sphingomonas ginsenosidivorax TaxID=862135 RepID=A0A5C6UAM5_9SPHN|nr:cysteine desulfurase family protein [Sphingomonas ginsenosidivorax]TXC69943.1 cysteine desulfurase [Sphingomonas ginsenosidivorax]
MPIYLDGLSTTPLAPEAREAMLDAWSRPGNPGSPHADGERAALIVEEGRARIAELIGASPAEVFFTSGATEANNLAITGVALAALAGASTRRRVIVSAVEHKAVLAPALRLRELGFVVDVAPVDANGVVDLNTLRALIGDDTLLVSVMAVNNETGVLQPVAAVAALAHESGALFHCDAAQAVGKVQLDVFDLDVDYLSASSHKMYGPGGIGALYVSATAPRPAPLVLGGGQERGLRAGTEPTALVAGFGAAADLANTRLDRDGEHADRLLKMFLVELSRCDVGLSVNGGGVERLPGAASLTISGSDAQSIAQALSSLVMLSTGSACTSGRIDTSHVLAAMGLDAKWSRSTLRVHFNRYSIEAEAVDAARLLAKRVKLDA